MLSKYIDDIGASVGKMFYLHLMSSMSMANGHKKQRGISFFILAVTYSECSAMVTRVLCCLSKLAYNKNEIRYLTYILNQNTRSTDPSHILWGTKGSSATVHFANMELERLPHLVWTSPPASWKSTAWPWQRSWSQSCGQMEKALRPFVRTKRYDFSFK